MRSAIKYLSAVIIGILATLVVVMKWNGLGHSQLLQSVDLRCTVLDASTRKPIEAADVTLVYQCSDTNRQMRFNGSPVERLPRYGTDTNGQVYIQTDSLSVWVDLNEAIGGGFRPHLEAAAKGYEKAIFKWSSSLDAASKPEERILLLQPSPQTTPAKR